MAGLLAAGLMLGLYPAVASGACLHPNEDLRNDWSTSGLNPNGAAFGRLVDEDRCNHNSVSVNDYIFATSRGQVAKVGFSSTNVTATPLTEGGVWFFARTGRRTRLLVSVHWNGTLRSRRLIYAKRPWKWRGIPAIPATQQEMDTLQVRFKTLKGKNAKVEALAFEFLK